MSTHLRLDCEYLALGIQCTAGCALQKESESAQSLCQCEGLGTVASLVMDVDSEG